jgi:MFS family permease
MITEPEVGTTHQEPSLPSPYGDGHIPAYRHLKFSAFWFASNFLWGAILTIMLPNEVRHMAPHIRVFALGFLSSVTALVAMAVPLVAGAMSDRCTHPLGRRRPFVIVGVFLNIVGLFLMWLAYRHVGVISVNLGHEPDSSEALKVLFSTNGFGLFMLAYMVVQFGSNLATAAYSGLIPDLVPENQRGTASGYMAVMSQAGTLLGIICAGVLFSHSGEAVKYFLCATVLATFALVTVMGVQETRLTEKPEPLNWGKYLRSLWIDPKIYPNFAWVWITRFLVMLGFYSVLPFLNYYLIDVINIKDPDKPFTILSASLLVCAAISGFVGGMISDKVGRKRVVTIANFSMALIGLGFIFCRDFQQVLIVGIVFGLGYGAYISVDWALGTQVLPSKADAAKEMGVWHIAMTLPQSIAAPIAGLIIESFGKHVLYKGDDVIVHYTVAGYGCVFVFASLCFAGGALFLRNIRGIR